MKGLGLAARALARHAGRQAREKAKHAVLLAFLFALAGLFVTGGILFLVLALFLALAEPFGEGAAALITALVLLLIAAAFALGAMAMKRRDAKQPAVPLSAMGSSAAGSKGTAKAGPAIVAAAFLAGLLAGRD
ncbi:MAG: phage holin family protein [Geminicoccaceae bacterium]